MSAKSDGSLPRRCVGFVLIAFALVGWVEPSFCAAQGPAAPIDINGASRDQLKTLPGIRDAEAWRIIAKRPYRSKADLATAEVIPTGVFLSIKHRIIAVQRPRASKQR